MGSRSLFEILMSSLEPIEYILITPLWFRFERALKVWPVLDNFLRLMVTYIVERTFFDLDLKVSMLCCAVIEIQAPI